MNDMPWLRLYTDTVDNEKLRLLAFEDRWHFIAILCLKQQGVLDGKNELLERKMAVKMGVQLRELDEIKRRLMDVDLIDQDFQPTGWENHQFESDSAKTRMRKYRKNKQLNRGNVTVTSLQRNGYCLDTDTDTDTDKDKERERERKKSLTFRAPGLTEIKTQCEDKKYKVDPLTFFNYYEANGWKIGRNKMKSWKHALAMWESREPTAHVDNQILGAI